MGSAVWAFNSAAILVDGGHGLTFNRLDDSDCDAEIATAQRGVFLVRDASLLTFLVCAVVVSLLVVVATLPFYRVAKGDIVVPPSFNPLDVAHIFGAPLLQDVYEADVGSYIRKEEGLKRVCCSVGQAERSEDIELMRVVLNDGEIPGLSCSVRNLRIIYSLWRNLTVCSSWKSSSVLAPGAGYVSYLNCWLDFIGDSCEKFFDLQCFVVALGQ